MSDCNTCADVDAQGSELMLDLTKSFAEQYSITPPVGTQFKVSVASESQPFLELSTYRRCNRILFCECLSKVEHKLITLIVHISAGITIRH